MKPAEEKTDPPRSKGGLEERRLVTNCEDLRTSSPERYLRILALFIVGAAAAALLFAPLLVGVWLPDVFIDRVHTLAEQKLANGNSFRVIQYWNHGDFYNTELIHTAPDGTAQTYVLDPDDRKTWKAQVFIDEPARKATVSLSGGRSKTVNW